jgi:hypothetical protein
MTEQSGRQTRQDEVRQERRRRDDTTLDGGQALNLAIPQHIADKLAAEGRTPRWVNDVGSRMHRFTVLDDWDKVEGVEPVEVVINQDKGTTAKAILLSKRNDFIAEDRAKKDAARRAQESAALKGQIANADNPNAPAVPLPDNFYPDKANKIGRGNQIL